MFQGGDSGPRGGQNLKRGASSEVGNTTQGTQHLRVEEDLEVEGRRHGSLGNRVSDADANGKEGALGDESSGAARRGQTPEQQRSRVLSRMGRGRTFTRDETPGREEPGLERAARRETVRRSSEAEAT